MEIKGFIDTSLVDWDGKVSCVIFLPYCNLRCPFCYNVPLVLYPDKLENIPFEQIESYLRRNRKWIDGVVITGGEPTVHKDLPELCLKIKRLGFLVKLDTNGTNPSMVRKLVEDKLLDYIAMDVKAPLTGEAYSRATGVSDEELLKRVRETIDLLLKGTVDYEFRTTIVPTLHGKREIEEICQAIKGCKKYALQVFRSGVETIDPKFKDLNPFTEEEMLAFLEVARKFIPNTLLRGYPSQYEV